VGITDLDWYELLSSISTLTEANFWQPSGNRQFKSLNPGELFLFKLHSPNNFIVGGGFFAHFSILPVSLAWESFELSNGAQSLEEMRTRIEKYRHSSNDNAEDYSIGCILLEQPFFLPRPSWIPIPSDWNTNIVQGRSYDLTVEPGLTLWKQLSQSISLPIMMPLEPARYGSPVLIMPRLGQGSFRILVTDAYDRRCAITNERTLPVLDAAHIKPYSENGLNEVRNGILLRMDLHVLFDKGYLTINKQMLVEVSRRIKEEFDNGKEYYRFQGGMIHLPKDPQFRPSPEFVEWHNNHIFRG
jgi:putative restriction endonuclease